MSDALIPRTAVTEIVALRDAAVAKARQAAITLARAERLADEAADLARQASAGHSFYLRDRSKDADYRNLFHTIEPDRSTAAFREHLDACVWTYLMERTGLRKLMDRTAVEDLERDLAGDVPEVSERAVWDVLSATAAEADLIFARGLARAFGDLDRRFKSHDAFKIGTRIILTCVFNEWGSMHYDSHMRATIADIERVFAVLDGQIPDPGALAKAIESDRPGYGTRQSVTETPYFRVRCFKNGNAHLWMLRDDLVDQANQVLADYYGEVMPDAATPDWQPSDIETKSGLPSKDLAFYPTSPEVVDAMIRNVHVAGVKRVLDPSAGTGNIITRFLERWAVAATSDRFRSASDAPEMTAIEIHPERAQALRDRTAAHVIEANFLTLPAQPVYDIILMNPPFYGTHWMEHVTRAYDWLAPGGTLKAVLPISADLGTTAKHTAFRKWAEQRTSYYGRLFEDLPAESFAHAGTRINTVILTLGKPTDRRS